jgi:hypothetical protein
MGIVQRISPATMELFLIKPIHVLPSHFPTHLSDCVAGMLDGQEKAASLTEPYKIGFQVK